MPFCPRITVIGDVASDDAAMATRKRLTTTATRLLFLAIVTVSSLALLFNLLLTTTRQLSAAAPPSQQQFSPRLIRQIYEGRNDVDAAPQPARPTSMPSTVQPSTVRSTTLSTTTTTKTVATTVATTVKSGNVTGPPQPYDWTSIRFVLEEAELCRVWRPDLFVIIYVHTSPDHFKQRALIRRTYGDTRLYARLRHVTVFVIGRSQDSRVARAISLESQRHRDIVQVDFADTYRNLSIKALAAFAWLGRNCYNATYVLKVDDDVFVNVFNLVRHLQVLSAHSAWQDSIHCLVWTGMPVLRRPQSKWYVSPAEFTPDVYPPYCSGSAFFMRGGQLVQRLLDASKRAPFLWVDDAYATGVLAAHANITHNSITSIVSVGMEDYDKKLIEGDCVFGHMPYEKGLDMRHQYWKKLLIKEEWTMSGNSVGS